MVHKMSGIPNRVSNDFSSGVFLREAWLFLCVLYGRYPHFQAEMLSYRNLLSIMSFINPVS